MLPLSVISSLTTLYNEPHRHYHNLSHVQACLRLVDTLVDSKWLTKTQADVVETAIWFHDAVYDPRSRPGRNEERSAELFLTTLLTTEMVGSEREVRVIHQMIRDTANHKVTDQFYSDTDLWSARFFLDIDLSILGEPRPVYAQYMQAIRKEYSFVPLEEYKVGRTKALEALLSRDPFYLTGYFSTRTANAKQNLEEEIKYLAEGVAPAEWDLPSDWLQNSEMP